MEPSRFKLPSCEGLGLTQEWDGLTQEWDGLVAVAGTACDFLSSIMDELSLASSGSESRWPFCRTGMGIPFCVQERRRKT